MLIRKVVLHNIRSYIDQAIELPQGSTLLAGDIGSGKSTILLAIEFALFGIARGVLSGNSMLRTGTELGWVELHLSLDNAEVVIKRTLKKQGKEVRQDTGWLTINSAKKEATAVELKSEILSLLGYPQQLLTKSKSLIYRYTVYTPQEEMKRILDEQTDYRVDTLRRLFQIDKYKRIRENSQLVVKELRQQQSTLRGQMQ
ncbi:MAG: SMC family ATPase, partial [Candidatus Woesearchaeota archaeon]